MIEKTKAKINNLADVFSELARNFQSLSTTKLSSFEEITPSTTKIFTNIKMAVFRWGNSFCTPKKTLEKHIIPTMKHYLTSNESINSSLKKQTQLSARLSYSVNKIDADAMTESIIKVFGKTTGNAHLERKERKLRYCDSECYSQFLNFYKADQEELMRCGINMSITLGEMAREEEKIWVDLLESFKLN